MTCLIPYTPGKWEWKGTCSEGESTCPRQLDGTFFSSVVIIQISAVIKVWVTCSLDLHETNLLLSGWICINNSKFTCNVMQCSPYFSAQRVKGFFKPVEHLQPCLSRQEFHAILSHDKCCLLVVNFTGYCLKRRTLSRAYQAYSTSTGVV